MFADAKTAPMEPTTATFPSGFGGKQEWVLPTDTTYLEEFLGYIFANYWADIVYGPLVDGASYELMCPCEPTEISFSNGYLTIGFDGPHFHLCIGPVSAGEGRPPVPEDYNRKRMPSSATIFRQLDAAGAPVSWGFDMKNGAGEPMMTIFFASPFVTRASILEQEPKWERLAMWRDISGRYLYRAPEAFDESGVGYSKRTA